MEEILSMYLLQYVKIILFFLIENTFSEGKSCKEKEQQVIYNVF